MRIGQLDKRVTIQETVRVPDGGGGYTETWKDVATVWASLQPLSGREVIQSGQLQAQVPHRVRIRYRPGITAANRLTFKGRTLEIISVANIDERNVELELLCQEVVGQ